MRRAVLNTLIKSTFRSPGIRIKFRQFSTHNGNHAFFTTSRKFRRIESDDAIRDFHIRLYMATEDPVWMLLNRLAVVNCGREDIHDLSRVLKDANVTFGSYNEWSDLVVVTNLSKALEKLWEKNSLAPLQGLEVPKPVLPWELPSTEKLPTQNLSPILHTQPPHWLSLHLISSTVKNLTDAELCTIFTLAQLSSAPDKYIGPMIVLAVQVLSRWGYEGLLTNLLHDFIHPRRITNIEVVYDLLLQALSRFPTPSSLIAHSIEHVLIAMEPLQLRPSAYTYNILLNSDSLTMEIAKRIRDMMMQEDRTPTLLQLNRYLTFLEKGGHTAFRDYLQYVQEQSSEKERSILKLRYGNVMDNIPVVEAPEAAEVQEQSNSCKELQIADTRLEQLLSFRSLAHQPEKKVPLAILLRRFREDMPRWSGRGRPVRAWYTVAILGLTSRKQHRAATEIFQEYIDTGSYMDRTILRAGLEAMVLTGDVGRAFDTLVQYTKPVESNARLRVDTTTLNVFMNACQRVHRPDVVFKLWECASLGILGCTPDGSTMGIMLDSARLAGGVRGLGYWFGFRTRKRASDIAKDRLEDLQELVHQERGDISRYSSSWEDEPPAWRARSEFLVMLFNSWSQLASDKLRDSSTRSALAPFPISRRSFFAYLHLLVSLELGEEIPDLLNWMAQLSVPFDKELLTMAVVGWTEHNSSAAGIMGAGGSGDSFIQWMKDYGMRGDGDEDVIPTKEDMAKMRKRLWFEMDARRKARSGNIF